MYTGIERETIKGTGLQPKPIRKVYLRERFSITTTTMGGEYFRCYLSYRKWNYYIPVPFMRIPRFFTSYRKLNIKQK